MPGELDHQKSLELIDQLLEFGEPYPALLLTGGDPLMRDDFFDLIEYAKEKGVYVAVAASVTPKLNETTISRMKEMGVDIMSLSLDGALPETHDKLRGVKGTWEKTIHALQLANEAGLRTQINTTVMRSNINELPEIFHFVRQREAVAWEVFFLIRTGRGASRPPRKDCSPLRARRAAESRPDRQAVSDRPRGSRGADRASRSGIRSRSGVASSPR